MIAHDNSTTQVHGSGYKFVSLNVRGLGHVMESAKVFAYLKSLSADMFLQETHIKHTTKGKLKVSWVDQQYEANFSSKARGVAILIRKNVPTINDPNGRFLVET